jgi:hypothetical protein
VATTIIQLSRELSYAAGDAVLTGTTDGKRFTAQRRLEAIKDGCNMVVNTLLGMSTPERKTHTLLQPLLSVKEDVDVNVTGYDFSNLGIISDGIESVSVVIDGRRKPAHERTIRDFQLSANQYLTGSDDYPTYYIMSRKLYVEIDIGSYPVQTTFHYVRAPKTPVYTGPGAGETAEFELSDNLATIVKDAASAVLFRGALEPEAAELRMAAAIQQLQLVAAKAIVDADTLGGGKE